MRFSAILPGFQYVNYEDFACLKSSCLNLYKQTYLNRLASDVSHLIAQASQSQYAFKKGDNLFAFTNYHV